MAQGRTKALLTIHGRQKGRFWNSSHRIRQKSGISIATNFGISSGDERSKCDLLSSTSDVDIDVVYGSPESWGSPEWSKALKNGFLWKQTVCLIVDKAHAVSAC